MTCSTHIAHKHNLDWSSYKARESCNKMYPKDDEAHRKIYRAQLWNNVKCLQMVPLLSRQHMCVSLMSVCCQKVSQLLLECIIFYHWSVCKWQFFFYWRIYNFSLKLNVSIKICLNCCWPKRLELQA